ncbi:hypothetical protein LTR08_003136 [Meristemomyces frigidus]|nr:hypothetical protein LTR08_003136 [Meristemomyces frigidus]
MIKHAGTLSELGLWTFKTRSNRDFTKQLHATAISEGTLIATLFSHVAPFGEGPALHLTGLTLSHSRLQYSTRSLTTAIDFSGVKRLNLQHCHDADALLLALTASFSGNTPALEYFSYDGAPLQSSILEGFLQSFSGLGSLLLRYCTEATEAAPFNLSHLKHHRDSLQTLLLHMLNTHYTPGENDSFALSLQEVTAICEACPRLQQIIIAPPMVTLGDAAGTAVQGPFGLAVDELAKLRHLRTLRIANWPVLPSENLLAVEEGPDGGLADDRRKAYLPFNQQRVLNSMQIFATDTMHRFAASKGLRSVSRLPTIKIGAKRPISAHVVVAHPHVEVQMKPVCILATSQADRYGRQLIKAEHIRMEDHEYLEGS